MKTIKFNPFWFFVFCLILQSGVAWSNCPNFGMNSYLLSSSTVCSPQYVTLRVVVTSSSTDWLDGAIDFYLNGSTTSSQSSGIFINNSGNSSYADFTFYASEGAWVRYTFYDYIMGCDGYGTFSVPLSTPTQVLLNSAVQCDDGSARMQLSTNPPSSSINYELYYYDDINDPSMGFYPGYRLLQANNTGFFQIPGASPLSGLSQYYVKTNAPCNSDSYYRIDFSGGPTVSGNASVCEGSSINLTASGNSSDFKWVNSAGSVLSQNAVYTTPNSLSVGTYTFFAKSVYGICTSTPTSKTITVNPRPIDSQISASRATIYLGESVTISVTGGNGSPSYWCSNNQMQSWNVFENSFSPLTSFSHTPSTEGQYIYHVRNRNECGFCWESGGSCSPPQLVYVTVIRAPIPNLQSVSINTCGPKLLTFASDPSVSYYWQGTDAGSTSTAAPIGGTYTVSKSGTYYVRSRSDGGAWSNPRKIIVFVDPVDIALTEFDIAQQVMQSTHSITLGPNFTVPAGNTFNARIAVTNECNDYLNWTEQIAFDQNGNPIGRSKAYQDGFGNNIQNQSIDYINNKVWASQPLFDNLNNPSASTMSAPILANDFIYKQNFVQNQTGQRYSASDFDLPDGSGAGEINNPKPVGNAPGTLGWYYSSANNLESKTPATAFPYSRSYTPEGPNPTTSKSAGVGENYKMGSGHESKGDRYTFGSAVLSHYAALRPFFTTSTSPLTGYIQVSTDANQRKAATFTDADGKTLASAMITTGTSPSNFQYDNWSYSFYNEIGQLVASVAPNGVNIGSNSIPQFVTYYKYDHLGRLIETTSPDEGMSQFVYSTDGKIRFSQNEEQRKGPLQNPSYPARFSYTNYDYLGRLIESGEYEVSGTNPYKFEPHTIATPSAYSVLNILDNVGYTGATGSAGDARCKETNFIQYDVPATDYPTDALHPLQANLIGQVVRTKNDNTTTWYSYDEFGQLTWMKQNIAGLGIKTVDYTYDYFGNVTTVAYQQGQPDAFYHHYDYDKANRLTNAYTSLDGTTKTLQAKYFYYLHGPLKRVELGNNIQGIDYVYNIDGSLKLINHPDPASDPGNDGPNGFKPDIFGMALDYTANDYVGANYNPGSLTVPSATDLYGGPVKAVRWHSQTDNHVPRAYAFGYDSKYQLATSTFGNVTGSGSYNFAPSGVNAYQENIGGYDKNGNINSLSRKNKAGTSIANFGYNYKPNTNQLASVTDNSSPLLTYQYNSIGQMTQQTEGGNTMKVSYTTYGLTKEIRDGSNKLKVAFAYDDRGNRVKKTAYNASGAVQAITYYVSDAAGNTLAIYEQDVVNNGQMVLAEVPIYAAGRVGVYKPPFNSMLYEVSDHLGNVRGVVGKPMDVTVTATYETANWPAEQQQFVRTESARRINATLFDHTKTVGASYSQRLNGSANEKYGIARPIAVLPGDVINAEVFVKYVDPNSSNWTSALATLMTQIAANTAGVVVDGAGYANPSTFPYVGLNGTSSSTGTGPKAYLNWLVFDKNYTFNPSLSGYMRLSTAAKEAGTNVAHERLYSPSITVTEPGYVYIYISNEELTPIEVYFDDFKVTQNMSDIVAGADYYPFGLPIPERELTREPYRYGYQGQFSEKDKETGFNSFDLRFYDARIGRWVVPDPYKQYASNYVGMGNNPTNSIDTNGGYVYILGPGKPLLGKLLGIMSSTKIGNGLLSKYINDPHRHVYITLGKIKGKDRTQGLASPPYREPSSILLDARSKYFFIRPSENDPHAWDILNNFNNRRIPGMDDDFWLSTEFNFIVVDESKIGSSNNFGLLDVLGHEFAHLNTPGDDRGLSHSDPSLWGTSTMLDPKNLDSNILAGKYGAQIQDALNKGSSQMWTMIGARFITTAFLGSFLKQSVGAISVPVNGVIKRVLPTIP